MTIAQIGSENLAASANKPHCPANSSATFDEPRKPKFLAIADRLVAQAQANEPARIAAEQQQAEREEAFRLAKAQGELERDIRERHKRASLEGWNSTDPRQSPILDRINAIAAQIESFVSDGRSLLFYGPTGTGKDHLAIALLRLAASAGFSCRWQVTQMYFDELVEAQRGDRSVARVRNEWLRPQVLCLSDPVMDGTTDANRKELYRIVNERWLDRKCTWVTCNVRGQEQAKSLLGEATFSRLIDGGEGVFCNWGDYRQMRRQR